MPSYNGKHVKRAGAHARDTGSHAAASLPRRDFGKFALYVFFAALIIFVPFSFNKFLVALDQNSEKSATYSMHSLVADSTAKAVAPAFANAPAGSFDDDVATATDFVQDIPSAFFTDRVTNQSQMDIMPGGCELVSLDIVLDSMGLNTDIHELVANHLEIDGHFATGYAGDPYYAGGGFPLGISNAANSYLLEIGSSYHAYDLSNKSFDLIKALILKGYPVMVWTTMGYEDPVFEGAFDYDREWYSNEHCVVVYGFDGDNIQVSDPLEGLIECGIERFEELYVACGSMALVIY